MKPLVPTSAEDLRVALARAGVPAYVVGGVARVHPMQLSRLLRGHDPITPEVATRVLLAIQRIQQEAADAR